MTQAYDTLIIGAGMGGLSAAIRAASRGASVHIIEALNAPGGKVGTSTSTDGVEFDTGPSLLTMLETVDNMFQYADTTLEDELTLITPSPVFRYIYHDGTELDVHHRAEETRESIRVAFGQKTAREFDAFMKYSRQIWEAALPNFVEGPAPNYTSALVMGVTKFRQVLKIDPFNTMWQGICKHVTHPQLRMLLARYATYNGSNPYKAPATLNCIAWVELGLGGYGISGGMAQLARAMANVAERLGVTMEYNTQVSAINVDGQQRITGVTLSDGRQLQAKTVVANADATHVLEQLLPQTTKHDIPEATDRSMSGWTGVMKAPKDHEKRAAHTVVFPENYEREFEDIFDHLQPPRQPTIYLCDQTQSHHREGWADANPVFVMANAPHEPATGHRDDALYEALEETIVSRLRQHDLWDDRNQWVWRRKPRQLAETFPGSYGSIYGASSNSQTAAFKRPPNEVKRIPGLFLASGSAHPGGGVPMCIMSGQTAGDAVLKHLGK